MKKYLAYSITIIIFCLLATVTPLQSNHNKNLIGVFYEWEAKSNNSRPDQIRIDPFNDDIVWFTQPKIHGIAKFNSITKSMTEFNTKGSFRPDGLIIDSNGILWFGEQGTGSIGKFDPITEEFEHFFVPYENANPAIPTIDNEGLVWVSDHLNNRIIRFNPKTKKYLIIHTPTPNSWVVDLKADNKNRIWYTCYQSNRIGVISRDRKTITEYVLPSPNSGPAFLVIDTEQNIWFTCWKTNKIGKFNTQSEIFTEYTFRDESRPGPSAIAIDSDDIIYFSTKYLNSIVKFNPNEDNYFYSFTIPTPNSGQKDGITVDKNYNIWFTEFDENKIARMKIYDKSNYIMPGNTPRNMTIQSVKMYKVVKNTARRTRKSIQRIRFIKPDNN